MKKLISLILALMQLTCLIPTAATASSNTSDEDIVDYFYSLMLSAGRNPEVFYTTPYSFFGFLELLPPDKFTPENILTLLSLRDSWPGGSGHYDYVTGSYVDGLWVYGDIAGYARYYTAPKLIEEDMLEVVIQRDCVEFSNNCIAYAVFSDGTIEDGAVEYRSDGERNSIVLPSSKIGLAFAAVISWIPVRGTQDSLVSFVDSGYIGLNYPYAAVDCAAAPYEPTPRTATGSIQDIIYITEDGRERLHPNTATPGN